MTTPHTQRQFCSPPEWAALRLARADATGLQASLDSPAQPMRRPATSVPPPEPPPSHVGCPTNVAQMAQPGDSASSERGSPTRRRRQSAPSATSGDVPLLPALGEPGTTSAQGWGERPFLDVAGAPPLTRGDGWFWLFFGLLGFLAGRSLASSSPPSRRTSPARATSSPPSPSSPPRPSGTSGEPGRAVGRLLRRAVVGQPGARHPAVRLRPGPALPADRRRRDRHRGGRPDPRRAHVPAFRSHIHNFNGPTTKLTGAAHGGGFVVIAVLTVVGAPFFEELFFRGLVLKGLVRVLTPIGPRPGGHAPSAWRVRWCSTG